MKERAVDLLNHNFFEYKLDISEDEIKQVEVYLQNVKPINNASCTTTYNVINILNVPLLKNLKNQIIEILDSKKLILKNNWAQLYKKNYYHEIHTHQGVDYGGIIYIKKNYNDDNASTFFYDIFQNFTPDKTPVSGFPFKEKTLLLFPAFIPHYVNPLKTDGSRIVISFNCSKVKNV